MTEPSQHPITPPPELVREWNHACDGIHFPPFGYSEYIATQAARWGADQELEACHKLMTTLNIRGADYIRNVRRPHTPFQSMSDQALASLRRIEDNEATYLDASRIHTALERLKQYELKENYG